jgi:uncharacterized membrane protein
VDPPSTRARPARLAWAASPGEAGRLLGVDVARAVALLGMAVTHVFAARGQDGRLALSHLVFSGRSAALFAVLAGISTALLTGRREPVRGLERVRASSALTVRALLLAALGLALVAFGSSIAVILTYYGLLFVCGLPFLGLRSRALLVTAAGAALVLPAVSYVVRDRDGWEPTYSQPSFGRLDEPGQLLEELSFTGYYPVVPWLTYLLVGLAVGRLDLGSRVVALRLLAAGAALAVVAHLTSAVLLATSGATDALTARVEDPDGIGLTQVLRYGGYGTVPTDTPWWLVVDGPHTGTSLDLAATTGAALAVLGTCLLLLHTGPAVRALLLPLAAAGSMTLTLYCLHVVAVSQWDGARAPLFYAVQVAVALVTCLLWRTLVGRGPLEAALAALTRPVRSSRSRRTVE